MAGVGVPKKHTEEEVIEAIKECRGNASKAAKQLKVCRTTFFSYVNLWPAVKQALKDEREAVLDDVEHVLVDAALEGQQWAVQFFLRTQGKNRGYTERIEKHTLNVNVDFAKLTDEQLQALAAGKDPDEVLTLTDGNTIDAEYEIIDG